MADTRNAKIRTIINTGGAAFSHQSSFITISIVTTDYESMSLINNVAENVFDIDIIALVMACLVLILVLFPSVAILIVIVSFSRVVLVI